MECYSAIKRNIFDLVLMRQMNLEPIIHSEVSQKEKHKYPNIYMQNLGKWYGRIYLQSISGETDIEDNLWTWGEGRRG